MSFPTGSQLPKGSKQYNVSRYTPQQTDLFNSLFSQVGQGSYLGRLAGGDQSIFDQIEAPAKRQFGELQGDIASRFSQPFQGAMAGTSWKWFLQYAKQRCHEIR